jgi:hypothetical protein
VTSGHELRALQVCKEVSATVEEMAHYPSRPSRSASIEPCFKRVQQEDRSDTSPSMRPLRAALHLRMMREAARSNKNVCVNNK